MTWGRRAVIVLLMLGLLWLAIGTAVNGVLAARAPATVLRFAPWSAAARIAMGNALVSTRPPIAPAAADQARRLAQGALARAPVQAAAGRVLGLAALASADEPTARAAFTYAERLSRRDLATELYWIESSVARGDIRGALHHYDVAMRTSVASRAMLGNVVIAAAAEPPVATELARLLRARPPWLPEFYQRLMGQGENPATLRYIAGAMGFDARNPAQAPFAAMALDRLVALGAYRDAESLYQRSIGSTEMELVRNGGFDRPNRLPPFDWAIAAEPTYSGILEMRTGWPHGTVLTVSGTEAHDVARQLLLLLPGRYRIDAVTANVPKEREARPVLTIACATGRANLASLPFAPAGATPAAMTGSFAVPAGCPAQWLTIRNTPSFDPVDTDPWIDGIAIRRVTGP